MRKKKNTIQSFLYFFLCVNEIVKSEIITEIVYRLLDFYGSYVQIMVPIHILRNIHNTERIFCTTAMAVLIKQMKISP